MEKIIGLGNALVDVLVKLDTDEVLHDMQLPKGCMTLIDEDKLHTINQFFATQKTHLSIGGSAGNAVRAMAHLGALTGFIGKVADDDYGRFFAKGLKKLSVDTHLLLSADLPSGVASTFISPGGQRTFGTYLGAASSLHASDLSLEMFRGYTYLFIEGYLVQDHDMILRAIELAKEAGLQVCLDLASSNIVDADFDFFTLLINKYVDVIFANEDEARSLTGLDPDEAVDVIAKMCSVAVVKVGPRGVLIRKGTERITSEATPVKRVVDTTGAGDFFAAGFLYGLTGGYSLEKCAQIGSLLAGHVIRVVGTQLSAARWRTIKEELALVMIKK